MNEELLQDLLEGVRGPLWGKYRGTVAEVDAATMRLKAKIPGALPGGATSGWCDPCVPFAGKNVGVLMLPEPGTGVWIEFERGEASRPIWVGCFWNQGEVPASASATVKSIVTTAGSLDFDDGAASVTLQDSQQDKLVLESGSAKINAGSGSVEIGASGVNINNGALEVT